VTITLFSISGFLAGYIVTRAYVGVLFARTERALSDVAKELETAKKLSNQLTTPAGPQAQLDQAMEPVPQSAKALAHADPTSAITVARARVIEVVTGLYRVLYGEEPSDTSAAISRLRQEGYLDAPLEQLAKSLDRLTDPALRAEALSPAQANSFIDSANAFIRSAGYRASLAFEERVGEALENLPGAEVVGRPRQFALGSLAPDFVVTAGKVKIVAEAYLPQPRLRREALERRIADRIRFLEAVDAVGLLVVLPDGVEQPSVDRPRVTVVRLEDVKRDAGSGQLLKPETYG
jgi:hypothetical protein